MSRFLIVTVFMALSSFVPVGGAVDEQSVACQSSDGGCGQSFSVSATTATVGEPPEAFSHQYGIGLLLTGICDLGSIFIPVFLP
jgi:hypothetical protein